MIYILPIFIAYYKTGSLSRLVKSTNLGLAYNKIFILGKSYS